MSEIKLKNCPFCGSEVELEDIGKYIGEDDIDHYYMIVCKNSSCGSSTCFGEVSKDDFIRTWNKRKPICDMVEKMEREYLGKPVSEEFEDGIIRAINIIKECAE